MSGSDFPIVQVVQEFSRAGGAETVAFELQRAWAADGVRSTVLAATVGADVPAALARPVRRALPAGLAARVPTRGRFRYLGRAALVPAFTLAATAALARGRRPGGWAEDAVVLSHGDSLLADAIVLHAVNAASLAQKRADGEWRWALNPMHLWVEGRDRLMLRGRRARRYVAVSRRVVDELARFHAIPPDLVRVIPNGTDLERFAPAGPGAGLRAQFAIGPDAPVLLFVGHEFDRKGLGPLVAALGEPGLAEAHVVAVGAGDAEPYRRQAAEAGVGARVHFTGPRADLPALYRDADVFVLPTAYETFSLVCMEAMACGLPVLATAVGGIEDYLRDGVNGFTITRHAGAIAAALRPVLADAGLRARLGAGARQTALGFGWEAVAQQYRGLLREISVEKRRRSQEVTA